MFLALNIDASKLNADGGTPWQENGQQSNVKSNPKKSDNGSPGQKAPGLKHKKVNALHPEMLSKTLGGQDYESYRGWSNKK